jgi:hypothetical protein
VLVGQFSWLPLSARNFIFYVTLFAYVVIFAADPSIVYVIMETQVQCMREYVVVCGGLNNLPQEESWDYYKSTGGNKIG